ncbi:AP2/ERF and B3 domain-containing transcription repressor TEM1-like [Triticum aestivum]|uniref:AP2/ERF and B3 domain-containing transcription repressor TEM1-like n=1 Tax=Triticum aestivum TaxID=4565 RepID=UPI001D029C08|nr:AP2/ERF and B3 domain-containing transcription repressor TEM1-like [Triticum aestivum]
MLARRSTTLPRALPLATLSLPCFLAASSARHHRATMPPCRRGSSGYRGVRERPNGWYSAEIRSGDVRLSLGSFRTAQEAARAYDAAAWRLERPHSQMNFRDVHTREQAQTVAPPPCLITDQDHADHVRLQRRLLIPEEDERAMAEWRLRHPEDVANERAYWAERTARRRAERADRCRRKALAISQCDTIEAGGRSIFTSDDERWDDI